MRRSTLTFSTALGLALGLGPLSLVLGSGCAKAPDPTTWKELEPLYFSSLNLTDEASQKALPDYEKRMEAVAKQLQQQLENGELGEDTERSEAGRTLLYQAMLLPAAQQAIEDGFLKGKDFLRPQRYASGGDDGNEQIARLARSSELLMHTGELRPDDARLSALALANRYNRESLDGQHAPSLQLDMLTAARAGSFSMYSTLVQWRDPEQNDARAAYMAQLVDIVCLPQYFDCNRTGDPQPPPKPLDGEHKLTQEVAGPVMVSDLLARRTEGLFRLADTAMTQVDKTRYLDEAQRRLRFAQGMLGFATTSAMDPALSQYPAKMYLPARKSRLDELQAGLEARQSGMGDPPMLPDPDYYKSRGYRAAYQCVACHTKGTTTMGFPK